MDEDFDEEFGDDVLPTSVNHQAASTYKEGAVTTVEPKGPQEEGEEVDEEEEGDVVLYGNMKESAAANNNPADEDDEDELEEEDEGIAIVLKDSTASPSKPQLRFTRGDNRYVRGDHVSPQLQPASRAGNEQFDPSFDELALLGMGGRRTAFDVDIDVLEDKPWRKPGVDISDYFNYGFDETTWREYCIKQQQNRRELAYKKAQDKEAEEKEKAKAAAEIAAYMPPPMGTIFPRLSFPSGSPRRANAVGNEKGETAAEVGNEKGETVVGNEKGATAVEIEIAAAVEAAIETRAAAGGRMPRACLHLGNAPISMDYLVQDDG
ncbi:hypothetical protein DYB37_011520 [Aphanomyces astaci]|uniref:Pre-mRNA polyadenylation factor Fip1 domain-containing protein n=1 Tax=Aphanomyces astaci TaxID=112090 RepID=A0A3R6XWG0_APHAT|nr:hypothetical protein DYB35_000969 [Aphanomyces astaci]RHZ05419.1 hypothetical protein DYB37_011520 [Aphanomyces astaci]